MLIHILKAMAVWNVWNVPGGGGGQGHPTNGRKDILATLPHPQQAGTHPPLQGTHTQSWEPMPGPLRPPNLASKAPNPDKNTETKTNLCLLSRWPGLC